MSQLYAEKNNNSFKLIRYTLAMYVWKIFEYVYLLKLVIL